MATTRRPCLTVHNGQVHKGAYHSPTILRTVDMLQISRFRGGVEVSDTNLGHRHLGALCQRAIQPKPESECVSRFDRCATRTGQSD
jgi:hypothetical protein